MSMFPSTFPGGGGEKHEEDGFFQFIFNIIIFFIASGTLLYAIVFVGKIFEFLLSILTISK